jgi:hypothetical protein
MMDEDPHGTCSTRRRQALRIGLSLVTQRSGSIWRCEYARLDVEGALDRQYKGYRVQLSQADLAEVGVLGQPSVMEHSLSMRRHFRDAAV